jgi:DNA helicase-2/ATP-dependent DNA helicase PcrA
MTQAATKKPPKAQQFNQYQREAIDAKEGAYAVIAGPGSGKTRVITERMAKLIREGVNQDKILLLTFTKNATIEMSQRVAKMTDGLEPKWINTFHKLCLRLLKEATKSDLTILEDDDVARVLYGILAEAKKKHPDVDFPKHKKDTALLLGIVLNNAKVNRKERMVSELAAPLPADPTPADLLWEKLGKRYERERKKDEEQPHALNYIEAEAILTAAYESHLEENGLLDFDLMIHRTILELRANKKFARIAQKRWDYIMVDEGQDTDMSQMCVLALFAPKNIMWIADPNQSIYGFRNADPFITSIFEDVFEAKAIPLPINYRSQAEIVEVGNRTIDRGIELGELGTRKGPKMTSHRGPGGRTLQLHTGNPQKEAEAVAKAIATVIQGGISPKEIAVLYRYNAQSCPIEFELMKLGIAYRSSAGNFWQRTTNRVLLASLKIFGRTARWADYLAFLKFIGKPAEKGDLKTDPETEILKQKNAAAQALEPLAKLRKDKEKAGINYLSWLGHTDFASKFTKAGEKCMENQIALGAVLRIATEPGGFQTLLSWTEKKPNAKKDEPVRLSTIHSAKGLEWAWVFLIQQSEGEGDRPAPDLAPEERRVFYVGATRAKDALVVSYSNVSDRGYARMPVDPNTYLKEIRDLLLPMKPNVEDTGDETSLVTQLAVPFDERDEAKKLGAKYDPDNKTWYIPPGIDPDPFAKWTGKQANQKKQPPKAIPESEKTYLDVPYRERAVAKELGALFDGERKLWYITTKQDKTKFRRWTSQSQRR